MKLRSTSTVPLQVSILALAGICCVRAACAEPRPGALWAPPLTSTAEQGNQNEQSASQPLPGRIERALAQGDLDAARNLVSQLLAVPQLSADTLLGTGVALTEHDMYPEAARVFERCVQDFPQRFEGYYNLALAELTLGKNTEALTTIEKAPRATPAEEVARTYLRGKTEVALGKNAEAERDLNAAFAAAPQEENYALDLGLYYLRVQKYQESLAVFQKATRVRKDSPYLELGLGLAQFMGGKNEESIDTCRALLTAQHDFSPARVLLAFALYMQGRIEEAEKTADEGLRDPNPFAYLYYLHAVTLIKLGSKDYDLMLNDLTAAARAIPQCSLCYLAMSKVHERQGERAIATSDLEKTVSFDPGFAEAWYRLATLYDQAGQTDAARQARQRFALLKEKKADRETEVLRDVFLKVLGGTGSP